MWCATTCRRIPCHVNPDYTYSFLAHFGFDISLFIFHIIEWISIKSHNKTQQQRINDTKLRGAENWSGKLVYYVALGLPLAIPIITHELNVVVKKPQSMMQHQHHAKCSVAKFGVHFTRGCAKHMFKSCLCSLFAAVHDFPAHVTIKIIQRSCCSGWASPMIKWIKQRSVYRQFGGRHETFAPKKKKKNSHTWDVSG